ncbi:fatty acid desaturase [Ruegeria sp. ANG-S4]|uniref:fatty acid desaturase n=1 Tax=Ruegeria sp. ANG-S4 TaxID=1577904 RepID=UPI00057CB3D6|nr:fatty acid desaturase [Ruegeria sp. ANG-S4]KIC44593.1 fatty acid desaturase [Ruegeria sp. ANG-S4]
MDHRALIASIPPETKDRLQRRSDRAGLIHLAIYFGALAACSAGIVVKIPFWPLLMLPQGVLLVFLFTLSHECTHKTPFKSAWINEVVGHLVSVPICLPFTWFRYFHLAHHKWTNHPTKDPELDGKPRPDNWISLAVYLSGWPYWAGMVHVLFSNARGQINAKYLPIRQHRSIRVEAIVLLAVYLFAATSLLFTPVLFWVWMLPVIIGQPFLRIYLLAEHGLCPPVANMLENSRTTFTNRLIRFLAWNMPYHAEHHAFPNVPFHQLPAFHEWTCTHLKSTSAGYAEFTADYARALER